MKHSRKWITIRVLVAVVIVAVFAVSTGGVTSAHYATGIYIWGDSQGQQQMDPMNVVFYNDGYWDDAYDHTESHLGWDHGGGATMYFYDHAAFRAHHGQRASAGVLSGSRLHIRFRQGENSDPTWGTYSQAAVHKDEMKWCGWPPFGHVAVDFDDVRDDVMAAFKNAGDGHGNPGLVWNDNTEGSPQCDGSSPSGDGYTTWIYMP